MVVNTVVFAANASSELSHWIEVATLIASVTAPIAMTIALAQYISSSRASARAHVHSILRDYLAIRATAPLRSAEHIRGYRYYAMEEVYYWVIHQGRFWNPASWISEDEKQAWLETVTYHIKADKGGKGAEYFAANRHIFGTKFRKHCEEVLGIPPKINEETPEQGPTSPSVVAP